MLARKLALVLLALSPLWLAGCGDEEKIMPEGGGPPVEALSLRGENLVRPVLDDDFRAEMEAELRALEEGAAAGQVDALIWRGRRLAYLGRYRDAVDHYTAALDLHGDDARLWRHRGHRYLTLRRLSLAIADLTHAATLIEGQEDRIEPDGLPNARNEPRSTLGTNIYYHLGLAHYLRGEWSAAQAAYRRCLELSANDDMKVATTYWLALTLARSGGPGGTADPAELSALLEPIHSELDIIENHDYHRLLLGFKGELDLDQLRLEASERGAQAAATVGYGVGAWRWATGEADAARAMWEEIVDGDAWPSFGHLAAEAELARAP